MMVSDKDLNDFALGFALSEGLIDSIEQVNDITIEPVELGKQVDIKVQARIAHRLKSRRTQMAGPTGCGLCGVDSIDTAMNLATTIEPAETLPSEQVINQARDALGDIAKANNGVRGNHCAAYFDLSGNSLAYREDVGRHSALDKLIGYLHRNKLNHQPGFALLSSRCSHDLVSKAASSGLSILVTLAQPTDLAVKSASSSGLSLFCFQHRQLKRFN